MSFLRRQWTLRRIMIVTAVVAGLLALLRYPAALGVVVSLTVLAWFVVRCVRGRRYRTIVGFVALCPALFVLVLYADWGVGRAKLLRPPATEVFDGMLGGLEVALYAAVLAFVASVIVLLKVAFQQALAFVRGRERVLQRYERAAVAVALVTPLAWTAILWLALLDPFGVLAEIFD